MNPADDREALVLFGLRETAASHDLRCVGRVLDQHDPLSAEAWGDCAHDFDCEADRTDASRSAALRAAGDACTALAGGDVAGAVAALAAGAREHGRGLALRGALRARRGPGGSVSDPILPPPPAQRPPLPTPPHAQRRWWPLPPRREERPEQPPPPVLDDDCDEDGADLAPWMHRAVDLDGRQIEEGLGVGEAHGRHLVWNPWPAARA